MNQRLAANRQRAFPLTESSSVPDSVLVDLQVLLSQRFGEVSLELESKITAGVAVDLTFEIVSLDLPGYWLVFSFTTADAEDTRVVATVVDSGLVAYPELGYGVAFIGVPADAAGGDLIGLSVEVDPHCVRRTANGQPMTLRVANRFRPGKSTCAETIGAPTILTLMDRVAETVAGCVETTTTPEVDQVSVGPTITGSSTSEVPIVPPTVNHTRYQDGAITVITTNAVQINDAIPTVPLTHEAEVDGNPIVAEPVLEAGHNVALSGVLSENRITLDYRLAAGLGPDCDGVMGYSDLGTLSVDCVKAVNGVHGSELVLEAGAGIELVSDPAGHRILVLINAEDLTRASA